ncbi:MAG: hypothetical protein IJV62_01420, partial [Eggerthellaceae bacterium]|nr:hypothetical protein [Eggerthellaceae bacterium]
MVKTSSLSRKIWQNTAIHKCIAIIAAFALAVTGVFIPTTFAFAQATIGVGNITQEKSGDGKTITFYDGTNVLYVEGNELISKSPEDADFDPAKATFKLAYIDTSTGHNQKNYNVTQDPTAIKSADHYNIIAPNGLHLTIGNEDANVQSRAKFSLRDQAFLEAVNVNYRVNSYGGGLATWRGVRLYCDRFSTDGTNQWFGVNATNSSTVLLPKPLTDVYGPNGEQGFQAYNADYTITWVDEDGATLYGPLTVSVWDDEPQGPENPVKAADDDYTYEFSGWNRQVDDEGNITYTATYKQTEKEKKPTT